MIKFFGYVMRCLLNPITSLFSVSEDFERKDSFELLLFRPICFQEDSSTLFLELTSLFLLLLLLFLFLTQIKSLARVYIPTISNCQSYFANSYKTFFVISLFHNNSSVNHFCYSEIWEIYVSYLQNIHFSLYIYISGCCSLLKLSH